MRRNSLFALAALLAAAAPAAAQAPAVAAPAPGAQTAAAAPRTATSAEVYRREVFRYARGGRPDPFQPLLSAAELGFRVDDLRLTSIVYSPNPQLSLAVFAEGDSARRHRMHVGQRLGTMTVLRIYPQRVDVRVDEFGGSRVETIQLQRAQRRAQVDAAASPEGDAAAGGRQTITVTPAPAAEAPKQPQPLRRGGARQPAQGTQPAAAPRPAPPPAAAPAPRPVNPRAPSYTRPRT